MPTSASLSIFAAALLLLGYGVVVCLLLFPSTRKAGRDIVPALLSATLIAIVIFGSFLMGGVVLKVALLGLAARIGFEVCSVSIPAQNPWILSIGLTMITATLQWWDHPMIGIALCGLWLIALARAVLTPGTHAIAHLLIFPVLPFLLFAINATHPANAALFLGCYILVESFDSYALLAGKLFGRTKAFPVLSPRKTIEGLLGGAVMLLLTATIAALILGLPMVQTLAVTALAGILTIAGDLAASRIKRQAGVKDFPILMKHQGGVLDSLDSWIAAGAGLGLVLVMQSTFF